MADIESKFKISFVAFRDLDGTSVFETGNKDLRGICKINALKET